MPKHTWSTSVKTDSGSGPVSSISLYGATEQNVGGAVAGVSGVQGGPTDVVEVDIALTVENLISFFMVCDQDSRVRTNSETVPVQEFNMTAGKALAWNNASIPQPSANPLTTNITKLFVYNKSTTKTANFQAGFLTDQESITS